MSKILIVIYRDKTTEAKSEIKKAFSLIAPQNINVSIDIIQSAIFPNSFVGVLNSEFEVQSNITDIISGFTRKIKDSNNLLEDGSYFKIKLEPNYITFNVDRFESKSLWYYQDEEKFIISNSQLLI